MQCMAWGSSALITIWFWSPGFRAAFMVWAASALTIWFQSQEMLPLLAGSRSNAWSGLLRNHYPVVFIASGFCCCSIVTSGVTTGVCCWGRSCTDELMPLLNSIPLVGVITSDTTKGCQDTLQCRRLPGPRRWGFVCKPREPPKFGLYTALQV